MVAISKYTIDQATPHEMSGKVFGNEGQLKVLGRMVGSSNKSVLLLVGCEVCAKDSELFGNGIFKVYFHNLKKGAIPCGCSSLYYWSEDQYKTLVKRKAMQRGWEFIRWAGDYKKSLTKLCLQCPKHGMWESTNIQAFLTQGHGCSECFKKNTFLANSKPDEEMIASFKRSGNFENTTFSRSKTPKKWDALCSDCGVSYSSHYANLQRGAIGCNCVLQNQKFAYTAYVKDSNEVVAVKFGIATSVKSRLSKQNKSSPYDVQVAEAWMFPDRYSCVQAEKECKVSLDTGVLSKADYLDGYTETTYVYNLPTILEIYKKHGGSLYEGNLW